MTPSNHASTPTVGRPWKTILLVAVLPLALGACHVHGHRGHHGHKPHYRVVEPVVELRIKPKYRYHRHRHYRRHWDD